MDSLRFTPTCVGTAVSMKSSGIRVTVHPHVRGDGLWRCFRPPSPIGSPPRAWGRLVALFPPTFAHRFTPTCVGTALP